MILMDVGWFRRVNMHQRYTESDLKNLHTTVDYRSSEFIRQERVKDLEQKEESCCRIKCTEAVKEDIS